MTPKRAREGDENEQAAEAVRRITDRPTPLFDNVEAAWSAWIAQIQAVDTRTRSLLKAAFIAGADVGPAIRSRAGGLKGGKARSAGMNKAQRTTLAKKAAKARWGRP